MEWIDLYGRASGARVNWGKSYLLQVGDPGIIIPEVQEVSPENPYVHLGIPVGTDLERHLKDYWERMMGRIAGIRSKWRRFHLSLKRQSANRELADGINSSIRSTVLRDASCNKKGPRKRILSDDMGR